MNETTAGKTAKAVLIPPNQPAAPSATPADMLQIAVQQGFDLDRLQKLIDMQDQWERKQAKKAFLAALSNFQTLVPVLKKGKTAKVETRAGGSYSYKYADLGSIAQEIKQPLRECGLSYRWEFAENAGKMRVTCHVSHIDGHTESATMEAAADNSGAKNDIQQKGSTQTYLQRYTLIGALGLATADEDNDSSSRPPSKQQQQKKGEMPPELVRADIIDKWKQVLSECKSKVHLNAIYLQNKSAVDSDTELQAMFKARQDELKAMEQNKVAMP